MSENEPAGSDIIDLIDFTFPEEPMNNDEEVAAILNNVPESPPNIVEIPMFEDLIPLNTAIPENWNEWSVQVSVQRDIDGVVWDGENWVTVYQEYVCVRYVKIC